MHLDAKIQKVGAVPLQGAVLCLDCECITNGRIDSCPVCASRSLLNVGQLLGGSPLPGPSEPPRSAVCFDLTFTIELKQMVPRELNTAIERITRMIEPRLGQRGACHINVQPIGAEPMRAESVSAEPGGLERIGPERIGPKSEGSKRVA
jgi:hypothetical protein